MAIALPRERGDAVSRICGWLLLRRAPTNCRLCRHESALRKSSGRRHRGLFALALAAACAQPSSAFAKEGWSGCFQRVYNAAHLAAHPGQTVKSIAVLIRRLTGR